MRYVVRDAAVKESMPGLPRVRALLEQEIHISPGTRAG